MSKIYIYCKNCDNLEKAGPDQKDCASCKSPNTVLYPIKGSQSWLDMLEEVDLYRGLKHLGYQLGKKVKI